jgi:NAD-dependent dihydropyrimidine dehydrogenase PreA subunit
MPRPIFDTEECIACSVCVDACPQNVLAVTDVVEIVDEEKCIGCGDCMEECPMGCFSEISQD